MNMYEPTLALASDEKILAAIRRYQDIQKRNPQTSDAWKHASGMLAPLFNEMRLRHPGKGPAI
jgi:hypothetical protein